MSAASNVKGGRLLPAAPCWANNPPPRKEGWDHSERVLVYYAASPEDGLTDGFGIAYYHYNPPYSEPCWVDFANDRQPVCWWRLPEPPCPDCGGTGAVDSGGMTPWGAGISIACPSCSPNDKVSDGGGH